MSVDEMKSDYAAVLADLRRKREAIDTAILAIEQIVGCTPRNKPSRRGKLTQAQVVEIKARRERGQFQVDIAKELGISRGTIWNVLTAKRDARCE